MKNICFLLFVSLQNLDYLGVWLQGEFNQNTVSISIDDCMVLDPVALDTKQATGLAGTIIVENGVLVHLTIGLNYPEEFCWIKQSVAHVVLLNIDGQEWRYYFFPEKGHHLGVVLFDGNVYFEQRFRSFAPTCIQDFSDLGNLVSETPGESETLPPELHYTFRNNFKEKQK